MASHFSSRELIPWIPFNQYLLIIDLDPSTIINSFGHSAAISQLLTVPPYIVASK